MLHVYFTTVYHPTCLHTSTYPSAENDLRYCIKCQRRAECWFIFSLSAWHLYSCYKRKNNPDRLCYICGNVVLPNCQAKLTSFVKKEYCDYFGVKLGDKDKPFSFRLLLNMCGELRDWKRDKRKSMLFAIPKIRREGKDPISDCYFCLLNLKGRNRNKQHVQYPNVLSAIRLIPRGPSSSSLSCRAACTDIPGPLLLLLSIVHRLWQVFRATSRILT